LNDSCSYPLSVTNFNPRDFKGAITLGWLIIESSEYPITAIATKLLTVMLTIMAAHAGKVLRTSGAEKEKTIER
jgi:hypothetical protein